MAMDGAGASEAETCSEQGENLLPSSLSNLNYWPYENIWNTNSKIGLTSYFFSTVYEFFTMRTFVS